MDENGMDEDAVTGKKKLCLYLEGTATPGPRLPVRTAVPLNVSVARLDGSTHISTVISAAYVLWSILGIFSITDTFSVLYCWHGISSLPRSLSESSALICDSYTHR
jgi:hypothetical protein